MEGRICTHVIEREELGGVGRFQCALCGEYCGQQPVPTTRHYPREYLLLLLDRYVKHAY